MLYYGAVIKFLSSRSKWRFTRYFSRKYYTWFVTFSFPIWSSLTSSLLSHNRCYRQPLMTALTLYPYILLWHIGTVIWVKNEKLIIKNWGNNGKIELSAVWSKIICMISKLNERTPRVLILNRKYDLPRHVTSRNREI